MLAKLKQYAATINLIPNTAIQFLDFGFNLGETRVSRAFLAETGADGRAVLTCLYADDASGQFTTPVASSWPRTVARSSRNRCTHSTPPRLPPFSPVPGFQCRFCGYESGIRTAITCSTKGRPTGRGRGWWNCRRPMPKATLTG